MVAEEVQSETNRQNAHQQLKGQRDHHTAE
jgi:hypothetical protein